MTIGQQGVMAPLRAAVLALGLSAYSMAVQAQGFGSAASVNRSSPDVLQEHIGSWTDVFQARTDTQLGAPVQIDASTWRLEHRLGFALGYEFQNNLTDAVRSSSEADRMIWPMT